LFLSLAGVTKKLIDIVQTRTREDAFDAHVPKFLHQILQQLDLKIVGGRKVSMAALTGERMVSCAIPIEPSLTQASAGGDHSSMTNFLMADSSVAWSRLR